MHWTALLAYRRFPANARVGDDLPCVGCGYNLRSLTARGVCPECARPIGDSLFVLSKPDIVGRCLKTIGLTYLGVLAVAVPCLNPGAAWTGIVGMGILTLTAIMRLATAVELERRGEIRALPVIGSRLRALIFLCIADVICSIAAFAMLWYAAKVVVLMGVMETVFNATLIGWGVVYLVTSLAVSLFASAMALMLTYFLARWEFILHRLALIAAMICFFIALMVGLSAVATSTGQLILVGLATVLVWIAMALLALGMQHLGGGAEHESDTWEDLLESDDS